jgi:hypothetical protein
MGCQRAVYTWTGRDKLIYAITLLPFFVAFFGALYLLGTISIWLSVVLVGLYLLANFFQAACCVGCPYRGQYCPALYGVYLGNWLSVRLYAGREFDQKFFERNALGGELSVIGILVFAGIGLATLNLWYTVALVALAGLHMVLYITLICPKCSYNDTCPLGKLSCRFMGQAR